MKHVLTLLVATAVVLGCNDDDDYEWSADIQGLGEWEDLEGEAEAQWTEDDDEFDTAVEIRNDEPGAVRPWHVHFNDCATGGGIVGLDDDYPRLEVDEDGTATASVTVPQRLEPGAPYHVNIHLSDDELETIIACGDLELDNGPPEDARVDEDAQVDPDAGAPPY